MEEGPRLGTLDEGDQSIFLDLDGNGRTDLINFRTSDEDDKQVYRSHGQTSPTLPTYAARGKITRFTDGLGAWTEVEYKSLVQRSVYTRDNNGPYDGYGLDAVVYDVTPPLYVVAAAESLAPQHILNAAGTGSTPHPQATTRVEYYYTGAKLQGGGRSFLGFREVASYDVQSQMLTRTRYCQDFPFIGRPKATHTWYQTGDPWPGDDNQPPVTPCATTECENPAINPGVVLKHSKDTWETADTDAGRPQPYRDVSEEWHYSPTYSNGSLTGSDLTHRVVTTQLAPDDYGNIEQIQQTTFNPNFLLARKTTINVYDDDDLAAWYLGRLTCSTVRSERGPGDGTRVREVITRISTFGYNDATGILNRETVQADDCGDADGQLRTDYLLDDFGNRKLKTVTGEFAGQRRSRKHYDATGRQVEAEDVWLNGNWRETRRVLARNRFGSPTRVRNGQGVITRHYFDHAGRPHYTYSPDGAWQRTLHAWGRGDQCPAGTMLREIQTAADGTEQQICKDILGRETRTATRGFDGNWIYEDTHYDYAARVLETSDPYYPGGQVVFTRTAYDEIGRPAFITRPDDSQEHYYYDGLETTVTNALGQTRTVEENALGEKIRETADDGGITTYAYDPLGQLIEVNGPLPDTGNSHDIVSIGYDEMGHKIWQEDPDKGDREYRHNALGELLCQLDAKGQAMVMTYDDLGRKTDRAERSGVSDVEDCSKGTLRGVTSWTYGNIAQTDEFGQVLTSTHEYHADGASVYGWTQKVFGYDSLGRMEEVTTTIRDGQGAGQFERSYTEETTYDRYGRVFQEFDASGDNRGVRYHYNAHGYRHRIQEAAQGPAGQVYWEVQAMDARGQMTEAVMGNGTEVTAIHDPVTGRLEELIHDTGSDHAVDLKLAWDAIGRLVTRRDQAGHDVQGQLYDQTERFHYDDRNRIRRIDHRTDTGPYTTVQRLRYDTAGNILCKSDVGTTTDCSGSQDQNYIYGGSKPHAVTEVLPGAVYGGGNNEFIYDANGNLVTETLSLYVQREFSYTVSDLARHVSTDSARTEFHYGPDRQRTLRRDLENGVVQARTHYVGSVEILLEGSSPAPDTGEYRRYIGGVAITTYFAETGVNQTRYLHKDHLGSITAISDEVGQVVAWMSFDAWGQRRNSAQWHPWNEPPAQYLSAMLAVTPRGFTGHEHIEHANIVHMNGRIYDPHLGRFLQADPLVEDATTLNRYTYVHNNPLAYTDPSGFLSIGDVFKIAAVVAVSIATGFAAAALVAVNNVVGAYAVVAFGGAVAGAITANSVEGVLWGAFSAAVFFGIGQGISNGPDWMYKTADGTRKLNSAGIAVKSVSHGVAGGTLRELQGGKFGHGFFSAGITAAVSPGISNNIDNDYAQGVMAALVGGSVSALTGGKFANGAATAAMAYAFNQMQAESYERGSKRYAEEQAKKLREPVNNFV